MLPCRSSNLPEYDNRGNPINRASSIMLEKSRFHIPTWFCSRWGLPSHLCCQSCGALLPHLFTLTFHERRFVFCCAFPTSFLLPAPAVTRHLVSMEPGLSSTLSNVIMVNIAIARPPLKASILWYKIDNNNKILFIIL